LGYILGDFFAISSGHPADQPAENSLSRSDENLEDGPGGNPEVNVVIFEKKISVKCVENTGGFFDTNDFYLGSNNLIVTLFFAEKNVEIFRRKCAKIEKSNYHNIDPWTQSCYHSIGCSGSNQGCQTVCFQTKKNLGKFWSVLQWKMLVYFMDTWSILCLFVIFYGHLV
jgi:hypothetical protein